MTAQEFLEELDRWTRALTTPWPRDVKVAMRALQQHRGASDTSLDTGIVLMILYESGRGPGHSGWTAKQMARASAPWLLRRWAAIAERYSDEVQALEAIGNDAACIRRIGEGAEPEEEATC